MSRETPPDHPTRFSWRSRGNPAAGELSSLNLESLLLTADDLEETMFSSLGECGPTVERLLDPTSNALVPFTGRSNDSFAEVMGAG